MVILMAILCIDLKPDNVTINYKQDRQGQPLLERGALKLRRARGFGKASDVLYYGLMSLFVKWLRPDSAQLQKNRVDPELEMMSRLISSAMPTELVTHIQDEDWGNVMMTMSEVTMFTEGQKDYPNLDTKAQTGLTQYCI
ncbi:hypothetical protein McaMca56_007888 [Microsporum canis]